LVEKAPTIVKKEEDANSLRKIVEEAEQTWLKKSHSRCEFLEEVWDIFKRIYPKTPKPISFSEI
jgi:hypothetical protein